MNKKLDRALKRNKKQKQDVVIPISGELGIPLNGQKLVEVPNRRGFVFVRLKNNTSELIQAYNSSVSPIYDLPVLVVRVNGGYKVIGRNETRNQNQWGQAPYLPKHGGQHSFNPSLNIGGDIVWVYSQQFMPLLGYPSGSAGSPRLAISPYIIQDLNGAWKYVGGTGTPDTSIYNPTTGSRSIMGLLYIDTVSGNPYYLINSGTYIDSSLTGSGDISQYIPRPTSATQLPISAIRLVSGTSILTWDNVYDVRPFLQVLPTGSTSPQSLGIVGQNKGQLVATGTYLNVNGSRLVLTASGTVLNLSNSPDPMDNIGVYVLDDGTPVGTGTTINFGNNLTAVISGSIVFVDAQGSGGGGGGSNGIVAWDEGIYVATGTIMNFVGSGVTVTASGTVINVNVPGGSATPPVTGSIVIQDESSTLGSSTILNFVGDGVTASLVGTVATILITGSSSGRTLIATSTPMNTGTISFTNVPSTYDKLTLEIIARSTQAAADVTGYLQFNGDTTSGNYRLEGWRTNQFGNGNDSSANYIFANAAVPGASADASGYINCIIDIVQYANANIKKSAIIRFGTFDNAFTQQFTGALQWKNTNAINQINVGLSAGDFVSGTIIKLYGES